MRRLTSRVASAYLATALALPVAATEKAASKGPDFAAMLAKLDAAWATLKAENAALFYAKDKDGKSLEFDCRHTLI